MRLIAQIPLLDAIFVNMLLRFQKLLKYHSKILGVSISTRNNGLMWYALSRLDRFTHSTVRYSLWESAHLNILAPVPQDDQFRRLSGRGEAVSNWPLGILV